ncbi:MAG: excinuclease ABC subunit UvrC [Acidimicrobiia bacterium]
MLAPNRLEIPTSPGSYQFLSKNNEILYVGKAKNLRSRIMSYFQGGPKHSFRIEQMVEIAEKIEWIVVSNETESLLLEYSLIQQHKPRYNVRLKDDKSYPWLCISTSELWPRAMVMRGKQKKGNKYFGPYTSAYSIRETLDVLTNIFPVRTCSPAKFADYKRRGRGCLLFDIGKCCAPCIDNVSKDEYEQHVNGMIRFLNGEVGDVTRQVQTQMEKASTSMQFERAAILRDRLESLKTIIDRQEIYGSEKDNFDVIAYETDNIEVCVEIFRVRKGRLLGSRRLLLEAQETLNGESVYEQILLTTYQGLLDEVIPPVVYVNEEFSSISEFEELLISLRNDKVKIKIPERGSKRKLLELANTNANGVLSRRIKSRINDVEQRTKALASLHEQLKLKRVPLRIECFDISHVQGTNTVASMVVLDDGLPKKSEYRKFVIKHGQGNDDFLSMEEAITRRFAASHDDEKFQKLPDLLLIDGGKGQLSSAVRALESLGMDNLFDVASIAKKQEEIFLPGQSDPVVIPKGSLSLMLLQVVRDEAHRFAITHHRSRRGKAMTNSILDEIEGLGPSRKKKLLSSFGSVKRLKEQSLETLQSLSYLPDNVSISLFNKLHDERND